MTSAGEVAMSDERPVTRYAKASDGVSIAYQVSGAGPLNVVLPTELGIPIDLLWEEPTFVRVANRLRRFSRIVLCEPRGIGASGGDFLDSVVEDIADSDLAAIFAAAECERAVFGRSTSVVPLVSQFAVMHPDSVAALILINTYAHYITDENYPLGFSLEMLDEYGEQMKERWGTPAALEAVAP